MPLCVLHAESATEFGEQERRILSEAMGMVRRGRTVCLAVPPWSKVRELAERNGLEVEVVALK